MLPAKKKFPVAGMNDLIVYDNAINRASFYLSPIEVKIILCAIAAIPIEKITDEDMFTVSAEQLRQLGETDKNLYANMKKAANMLYERSISFTAEDRERKRVVKFKTRWVQTVGKDDGMGEITLRFGKDAIPFLNLLVEQFTKFRLKEIADLKGFYTLRIYGMLKQFERTGIFVVGVDDLRQRLDLGEKHKLYSALKRNVLLPVLKTINGSENVSINVDMEERRKGKKVENLIFNIRKKEKAIPERPRLKRSSYSAETLAMSPAQAQKFATIMTREMGFWIVDGMEMPRKFNTNGFCQWLKEHGHNIPLTYSEIRGWLTRKLQDGNFVYSIFDIWLAPIGYVPTRSRHKPQGLLDTEQS